MIFDPRAVPPSSWREWLLAGLALSTRRTGSFVAFGAVAVALHGAAAAFDVGVVVVPIVLGVGCLLAECADTGRSVVARLREIRWPVGVRLLVAGVVPMLGFWLVGTAVTMAGRAVELAPQSVPVAIGGGATGGVIEALCAAWFLSVAAVLFGTSAVIAFLVPLLALGGVPLKEAVTLALVASGRNVFAVVFVAALATTAIVGWLTPFLVVPWVAIVSSTFYAAWRDVFLGRSDNAPVRSASVASEMPAAPAR